MQSPRGSVLHEFVYVVTGKNEGPVIVVLAGIAYHDNVSWAKGGFLGVEGV